MPDIELELALVLIAEGEPLPIDLASILMERGYIIEELEKEITN